MITRPTVLVLGAGASTAYGYPAGKQLKTIITTELNNTDSELYKFLLSEKFSTLDLGDFREGLIYSATESIDEFLENRSSFTVLGKLCITYCLSKQEDASQLQQSTNKNWYGILVRTLCSGASFEGVKGNKIAIITFNYDRSLEQYITVALQHRFGKSEKEVAEVIKAIPIIHVHGQIGQLSWQHNTSVRSYGEHSNMSKLSESSKLIRIIHEVTDPFFEEASNHLQNADFIYFLGFGYHTENLRKLKIAQLDVTRKTVWGTSYHLNQKQLKEVTARANDKIDILVGGAGSFDVYTFLDENVTFN